MTSERELKNQMPSKTPRETLSRRTQITFPICYPLIWLSILKTDRFYA